MSRYNDEQYAQMAQLISHQREWAFDKFYRGSSGDVPNRHQREMQAAWAAVFDMAIAVATMFLQDNSKFDTGRWFGQAGYGDERTRQAIDRVTRKVA